MATTHRIEHYVYEVAGDRSTLRRRERQMRGAWPSEARCVSCGVETRTGGATEASVRRMVEDHKVGLSLGRWYPVEQRHRVRDAEARGHVLANDPPHGLSRAQRLTCTRCGRAVLRYADNVYGSALEEDCDG